MKNLLALLAPLLLCVSCVGPTPQSRIARNPQWFANLNSRDKQLVEHGQVARGMSQEAVLLAWGEPSRRYQGEQSGKPMERWDYTTREADPWDSPFVGSFYDPYGPYPYRGYGAGFGMGAGMYSRPVLQARVTFIRNRVDSWERRN